MVVCLNVEGLLGVGFPSGLLFHEMETSGLGRKSSVGLCVNI